MSKKVSPIWHNMSGVKITLNQVKVDLDRQGQSLYSPELEEQWKEKPCAMVHKSAGEMRTWGKCSRGKIAWRKTPNGRKRDKDRPHKGDQCVSNNIIKAHQRFDVGNSIACTSLSLFLCLSLFPFWVFHSLGVCGGSWLGGGGGVGVRKGAA